jgi:16S rRNA G966 N2-methylase RsmD
MATSKSPVSVLLKLMRRNYQKLSDARETFEVISNRMGVLDNPQELVAFLEQHLKPKELEKKNNGEVFTPPDLIQQKFNKLTLADPGIWSDPSKKFLDPANGIGNYPALAFHRLMEGLKNAIPNEADRKKHILENMLYMCELNKKNVEVSRKVFDPEGIYALKLYQGSYLDLDPKKEWGVEKFDVVFGNPPYQKKVGPKKTKPLWHLFVMKSINLLNKDGYVVFVHPSGWRSPDGVFKSVYDMIMERNLVYINMNNFKKGQEVFNLGTNFDYYILKNSTMKTTIINDIDDKEYTLDLKGWSFLPSGGIELYEKLLSLNGEEKVSVIHDYSSYETRKKWMNETKKDKFIHPCCYTITGKDGMKCFFSSEQKGGHFGIPKVIWSNGLGTYPIIDDTGTYGLTQFSYAIEDTHQNLEKIKEAMNSPKFIQLMEYVKFTNNKYNYKVIRLMKKDFWKVFVDKAEDESSILPTPVVAPAVAQPVAVATTTQTDYKKMTVPDLRQLCKDRKIKGITRKNREELIAMLSA